MYRSKLNSLPSGAPSSLAPLVQDSAASICSACMSLSLAVLQHAAKSPADSLYLAVLVSGQNAFLVSLSLPSSPFWMKQAANSFMYPSTFFSASRPIPDFLMHLKSSSFLPAALGSSVSSPLLSPSLASSFFSLSAKDMVLPKATCFCPMILTPAESRLSIMTTAAIIITPKTPATSIALESRDFPDSAAEPASTYTTLCGATRP
mmetsp:Transcript_11187/g.17579  ORF Transcript_11187/g.17579 Transcript_11187/m.17579 type:complete len:205 (-) Transcript_11187:40-654(-)